MDDNDLRILNGVRHAINLVLGLSQVAYVSLLIMLLARFLHDNVLTDVQPIGFYQSFILASMIFAIYYCFKFIKPVAKDEV